MMMMVIIMMVPLRIERILFKKKSRPICFHVLLAYMVDISMFAHNIPPFEINLHLKSSIHALTVEHLRKTLVREGGDTTHPLQTRTKPFFGNPLCSPTLKGIPAL